MKPKISDFYRLAVKFPSAIDVTKSKNNKYLVRVRVLTGALSERFVAYYEFDSSGVSYVGEHFWNASF